MPKEKRPKWPYTMRYTLEMAIVVIPGIAITLYGLVSLIKMLVEALLK